MPEILEQLGYLVPKETIGKLYDDMVAGTAKEIGKFSADVTKTARLMLARLQVMAAFQDRFEKMVGRIRDRVPDARMIESPAELVGPVLEEMRDVDERSHLWKMYEEVLTKSVDQDQHENIHPAFGHIISQLSRDEAWLLYRLRDHIFKVVDELTLNRKENRFENRVIIESELPKAELYLPDKMELYYSHLASLALVEWPVERQDSILDDQRVQVGVRRYSKMLLTDFGRLFVSACIPHPGFEPLKK